MAHPFVKTNGQFVLESVNVTRTVETIKTDYLDPIWIDIEIGEMISETPKEGWGSWGTIISSIVGCAVDGKWVKIGEYTSSYGDDGMYTKDYSFNEGISTTIWA